MNRATKIIIVIVIIGALVAAAAFKLTSNQKELDEKVYHPNVNTAVVVQVDTVKPARFEQATSFTGSFSPNREVTIGSETSGKVIKVNIQEGSVVASGSVVAELDYGLIQAQLQSAQASYEKAVNTVERYQKAVSGVTQLQLDNAKTDVLTWAAQIAQFKKQISQYTIRAPFSGVVTSRNFDLGAIVSPGSQMATLIDISSLKLEVNVPEQNLTAFRVGQGIDVKTDVYPAAAFKGKIEMVASNADASHNFLIKVRVDNGKSMLKSGMYGTVVIDNARAANAITIPRSALIGSSVKPQVYVVENGIARIRQIQIGSGNETRVQVTSGVSEGELVVSGGLVNLTDGAKVSIAK